MTFQPIETLPVGHYAVGQLDNGEEVDIYRMGPKAIMNVRTGLVVAALSWRKRALH